MDLDGEVESGGLGMAAREPVLTFPRARFRMAGHLGCAIGYSTFRGKLS